MPRALRLYASLVAAIGAVAAAILVLTTGPPLVRGSALLLVILGAGSQISPIHLYKSGGERHTLSFSAAFALSLVILGQPVAALIQIAAGEIGLALRLRLPAIKLGFNLGQHSLCVAAATWIWAAGGSAPVVLAEAGPGVWVALLGACLAYLALNEILIAGIFAIASGERWISFPRYIATGDGLVVVALVPVIIAVHQGHPWLIVFLAAPFAGLTWIRLQLERHAAERLALQRRLEEGERMEAIGRLAGAVAHDFNNLLTVILSASEFIQDDAEPGTTVHEDAGDIQHAAHIAAALTKQLLIFSRRERSAAELFAPDLVAGAMQSLLRRCLGKHIALVLRVSEDVPAVLMAPSRFEQLVLNLVVNARDAMPEGGEVVVELGRGTLNGRAACRLRVIDAGTGMSPEIASRIFEPFFTTKADGRGTGLGLATVARIVTDAAGTIDVQSALGRGTTFELLLPAGPEVDTAPAPDDNPEVQASDGFGEGLRALYADRPEDAASASCPPRS